jgi:hypothetical protein
MRTFFRKFAILVAAYALALQPIVAAMSAAPAHAAAAICVSGSSGDAPAPANTHENDDCCLAMGCSAPAGGAPVSLCTIAPVFNAAAAPLVVAKPAPRIAFLNGWQHAARAPPV